MSRVTRLARVMFRRFIRIVNPRRLCRKILVILGCRFLIIWTILTFGRRKTSPRRVRVRRLSLLTLRTFMGGTLIRLNLRSLRVRGSRMIMMKRLRLLDIITLVACRMKRRRLLAWAILPLRYSLLIVFSSRTTLVRFRGVLRLMVNSSSIGRIGTMAR